MPTLLMLKGLPASGKSTFAKALVNGDKAHSHIWGKNWKRVNKDDLRAMVDCSKWSKESEKYILHWRDQIIKDSLGGLSNVVVDDTNFAPKHEAQLRAIAEAYNAEFKVKFFDVPVQECVERDLKRGDASVGEKVIKEMYNQFLAPLTPKYINNPLNPRAIICDIDGTAAHMTKEGRLRFGKQAPFMWEHVGEDAPDIAIKDILWHYTANRSPQDEDVATTVIMLSGRDESCRPQTEQWLKDNGFTYDFLYMRPEGDGRKDSIVKRELFDKYIADKYNILFILDDRDQVVDMWRELGLKCLQVAEGNF